MKMVIGLIVIAGIIGFTVGSCDADAKSAPPIQPGQVTQCWAVIGTPVQTMQCQDGTWEVTRDDGVILHGQGPLPAEFQPVPDASQGPPPLSQTAPSVLFGIPGR